MNSDEADVEVFTAALADIEDTGRPTIPIVGVQVTEPVFAIRTNGPPEDLFRTWSLGLGMKVLASPWDVLTVDLSGWLAVCTPTKGAVIDREGHPWATGIAPFPMWNDLARRRGNRIGVLYTPGLFVPGTEMGKDVNGDFDHLLRLADQGRLIGGMAPLKTVSDPVT